MFDKSKVLEALQQAAIGFLIAICFAGYLRLPLVVQAFNFRRSVTSPQDEIPVDVNGPDSGIPALSGDQFEWLEVTPATYLILIFALLVLNSMILITMSRRIAGNRDGANLTSSIESLLKTGPALALLLFFINWICLKNSDLRTRDVFVFSFSSFLILCASTVLGSSSFSSLWASLRKNDGKADKEAGLSKIQVFIAANKARARYLVRLGNAVLIALVLYIGAAATAIVFAGRFLDQNTSLWQKLAFVDRSGQLQAQGIDYALDHIAKIGDSRARMNATIAFQKKELAEIDRRKGNAEGELSKVMKLVGDSTSQCLLNETLGAVSATETEGRLDRTSLEVIQSPTTDCSRANYLKRWIERLTADSNRLSLSLTQNEASLDAMKVSAASQLENLTKLQARQREHYLLVEKIMENKITLVDQGEYALGSMTLTATRIAILIVSLFLVKFFVQLYQYNAKLVAFYRSRIDLAVLSNIEGVPTEQLSNLLWKDIDFATLDKVGEVKSSESLMDALLSKLPSKQ